MKPTLFLVGVLLFAASFFVAVAEEKEVIPRLPVPNATHTASFQVVAFYFHGTVRCETCLDIEKQAYEFIQRRYKSELETKRLVFQTVNYDKPENTHFLRDYNLLCPSLVLVRQKIGTEANWKTLGQVWTRVKNREAFDQYLEEEINLYLNEPSNATNASGKTVSPLQQPVPDSSPGTMINSLADLNARFDGMNAAFVFTHRTNELTSIDWAPINRARRKLESEWDIKVGVFELKLSPSDYRRLAERHVFTLPTIMVVLQNGTTAMFSGGLTETNLVQKFVYTVSAGGCCALGEH